MMRRVLLALAAMAIPASWLPSILKPLNLSAREIEDVVAFLETLTDAESHKPRKPAAGAACR